MESLFPGVFFLSYAAPLLLRIGISAALFYDAKKIRGKSQKDTVIALGCFLLGVTLLVGFLTQLAVMAAIILVAYVSFSKTESVFRSPILAFLSLMVLLTLFFTGPGLIALDLPY